MPEQDQSIPKEVVFQQPEVLKTPPELPKNIRSSHQLATLLGFHETEETEHTYVNVYEKPFLLETEQPHEAVERLEAHQEKGSEALSIGIRLAAPNRIFGAQYTLDFSSQRLQSYGVTEQEIQKIQEGVQIDSEIERSALRSGGYRILGELIQGIEQSQFLHEVYTEIVNYLEAKKKIAQIAVEQVTEAFPNYSTVLDLVGQEETLYFLNQKERKKSGRSSALKLSGFLDTSFNFTIGTAQNDIANPKFRYKTLKRLKTTGAHPQTNYWDFDPENEDSIRSTIADIIEELHKIPEFTVGM